MAGSLFLFISVVAFIASHQKLESLLSMAWLYFGYTVVFSALCMLTVGVKKCFAICDQTGFLSLSSFAIHFNRIFLGLVFNIDHFHSSFFDIYKLSTFLFIFSNALSLLSFLFSKNLYIIVVMRVSTLCGKARTCRMWKTCDNSKVLAILTFLYRAGFWFSRCLMVLMIRFSILLVQFSPSVDASFSAE